jgi:hypothetical protein
VRAPCRADRTRDAANTPPLLHPLLPVLPHALLLHLLGQGQLP